MVDRVAASIQIGGEVSRPEFVELAELVADQDLRVDWDGDPFDPCCRKTGAPLILFAYDVPWGRFEALEAWCVDKGLSFARWSGACVGQWGAERVVFTGTEPPIQFAADEEDYVLIGADMAKALGSYDAILAHFAAAEIPIPPLHVEGDCTTANEVAV
jgi:hypothetical protein